MADEITDRVDTLERRIEQLEDAIDTQVRVVETEEGKRIVLENRQQTWFSPKYFRTILDDINGS